MPSRSPSGEGDVRFHQIMRDLWVLEARACARRWVVFHETYSFCLALRMSGNARVEWKYNHRLYDIDDVHVTMAMQPGELHANTRQTPPADFIVVQVGESLMKRAARELGWRFRDLNIKHPHPGVGHPALTAALRRFQRDLCGTLFGSAPAAPRCTCSRSMGRHIENLAELVRAFIEHCAENAREVVTPARGAAIIPKAIAYLRAHYKDPYDLNRLAGAAGCDRFYLPHVFREQLGVRPSEYQNRVLVARACDVLAHSSPNRPLEQIAQEIGWPGRSGAAPGRDTATLMIRHFRNTLGVTPGQFRAGLRGT